MAGKGRQVPFFEGVVGRKDYARNLQYRHRSERPVDRSRWISRIRLHKKGDPSRYIVESRRDGIDIRVVIDPAREGIITGFSLGRQEAGKHMHDRRLRLVRTDIRTLLDRVRRQLDPQVEVCLRVHTSREEFTLCLDRLLYALDEEGWSGILLKEPSVARIINLGAVLDRAPPWKGVMASPEKWDDGTRPTDGTGCVVSLDDEPRGLGATRILRRSVDLLYFRQLELALSQLLDRLEERFDPEWFSLCREFNEHVEYGLCLETVVDVLYDSDAKVPAQLLDRIHEFARIMGVSDQG